MTEQQTTEQAQEIEHKIYFNEDSEGEVKENKAIIFEDLNSVKLGEGFSQNESTSIGLNKRQIELIKINAFFKGLNFKAIQYKPTITNENTFFEKELTLIINPLYRGENIATKTFNINYLESYFNDLDLDITNFKAVILKDDIESIKPFYFRGEAIGSYYKDRNIMILHLDIFSHKDFYTDIQKPFSDFCLNNKIEGIDNKSILKKMLIQNFQAELRKEAGQVFNQMKEAENKQIKLRKDFLENSRVITKCHFEVENINKYIESLDIHLLEELQKIKDLPIVKKVGLFKKSIRVDFKDTIYYEVDDENTIEGKTIKRKVEAGQFYLLLNPDNIEIKNKNPVMKDSVDDKRIFHSPHIIDDEGTNKVCYGGGGSEGEKVVFDMLSQFKLKELVFYLYLWLRRYSNEHPYIDISEWIELKDRQKAQIEGISYEAYLENIKKDFLGDKYEDFIKQEQKKKDIDEIEEIEEQVRHRLRRNRERIIESTNINEINNLNTENQNIINADDLDTDTDDTYNADDDLEISLRNQNIRNEIGETAGTD